MDRQLILLRHGQTEHNASRRMQGQLDTHLSATGWQGARDVAEQLRGAGITRILSSDLMRAADTARVVSEALNVPVELDHRLRETHLGEWQNLTVTTVDERYPGARVEWRHDATWRPPGGESRVDVARRARPVIDELVDVYDEWPGTTVLVVAHGGTIATLTAALLGWQPAMYPVLCTLLNTRFGVLRGRPTYGEDNHGVQWYLQGWNMGEVAW